MKCSECSKDVKPIVVYDIDGTLGEWHMLFLDFAEWYLNTPFPAHIFFDGTRELHEFMGIPLEVYRETKLAFRQGGYKRRMRVTQGAAESVRAVREAGAEVWVATTRPYLRFDNIDKDTRDWLSRNGIPYDGLVYADDKFDMLGASVDLNRVIALIDDLPKNVDRALEFTKGAMLLDRPHNEHRQDLTRARDFRTFTRYAIDRVQHAWT